MAQAAKDPAPKKKYVVLRVENGNQFIQTPQGEISVPVPQSYREKHGYAAPTGIEVTQELDKLIRQVMNDGNHLLVRYIRKDDRVEYIETDITQDGAILCKKIVHRGAPTGVVVGFKHDDKVYIGWSKRANSEEMLGTKEDAKYAAIARALTDTLSVDDKGHYASQLSGNPVPRCVEDHFATFFDRIFSYFKDVDEVHNIAK